MTHQIRKNLGVTLGKHGADFRLWAPFATHVALAGSFSDSQIDLESDGEGYWHAQIASAEVGNTYRYLITTQDGRIIERNDPRARAITASDNGFSVITDNSYEWQCRDFVPPLKEHQVIYELHVGTFNRVDPATPGTFDTAIEKLDYLVDLGINMIELMPVTSMAFSNGWGYAPNYVFSVESMLGGRHGLMKFIDACHVRGIGVILDVVYNHFYPETDLWQFDGWSDNKRGGIYFYNDERGDTPWGGRPDYGRPEVRQFILDNVTMWLTEYQLDGLRVDSTIYMRNTNGRNDDPVADIPDAWTLLQDITTLAHHINASAIIIAEDCAANEYITKSRQNNGLEFDAQWELGFPHAIRSALMLGDQTTPDLSGVKYELSHTYGGSIFEKIIFSDSHDTAANGSVRLNEAASPDQPGSLIARQKALLASAVTFTSPGIPMVLQGSEFLQEGAFNDWQQLEWNNTSRFLGFVEAHRHLINLRLNKYGNTDGLSGENTELIHHDATNGVLVYHRWKNDDNGNSTVIIVNFSSHSFDEYFLPLPSPGTWTVRFNSTWQGYSPEFAGLDLPFVKAEDNNAAAISLAPYCVFILSKD